MSDSTHLGTLYDPGEQTAWTAYYGNYGGTQSTWRELYFDDARALGAKCAAIDVGTSRRGHLGAGYDNNNGDGDLTNAIASTFRDAGGPAATYVPIAPTRLLDTRAKNGIFRQAGCQRATNVPGDRSGAACRRNATAVTGDLTVRRRDQQLGCLPWTRCTAAPTTSNLQFERGDIVSRVRRWA